MTWLVQLYNYVETLHIKGELDGVCLRLIEYSTNSSFPTLNYYLALALYRNIIDFQELSLFFFFTCSIIKKRKTRKYILNAPFDGPATFSASTSISMTNVDQKQELGNPDFSTVMENKISDIPDEDTTL